MNYESCLERLAIATDASRDEIEKALAIEEDRCRVLAKIPTKKADAAERQQIISELRELLKTRKEKVIHTSVSPPTNRPQFSRATASSQANSRIDSLDTKPDLDLHLQKRLSRSSKGYHPDDANAITAPLTSPIKSYEESLRSDWDKLDQSAQTDQADDIEDGFAELPARNTSEIGFEEVAEVNFKAVVENEEIVDPGKIGEIRRAVNLWASSVPHHEYITLGNSIEIKQASRHPLFLLNIKTLTEKRRLIDRVSGYKNERLASNRIEPEAIDIWSFAVPEKLNFEYEKIEYEVARARQKFGCTKCETKGEMWCEKCQSTGLLLCRECNGQKQKGCYTCGGTGYKDGQLNVSCRTCLGKGAITCASCRDGWQQCSSCFGSRQISCDKCGGSGQLLKSYFIEVEYKPEDSSFTIFPKDFIESSKKNFIAKKYQSEVKEVVRIEGGSNFDFETLEAVDNQQVRVEILSFANSFKKRMARHLIEAAFCQTTRLLYSFEQTDYEMWLVGEKPRIYCLTSPVHDYDQKLARQAAQLLKAEDFEAVIHKLETAFKHTPNSSSSLVVLNDLLKKLEAGNSPDRTKKVAELGQQLLGPNIGIGFVSIQQKAVAKIRSEFTIVLSLSAFLSLAATLLLLYINAEVYALSITLFVAIPGLLIALGISLLPIAPKIEVRFFRILS
ncbi:MAG: hypothetical protein JNN15_04385, partial [Blastocatellia bacterium]|nr:hypothetical protein [Blastocatellia bacterium]